VIDPFINQCWGLFAIDYNEDYEPHIYLADALFRRGVSFLVSPEAAKRVRVADIEWPAENEPYKVKMLARLTTAAAKGG
jgi:hypothetical protein